MLLLWPFLILGKACAEASLSIAAWRILPQFCVRGNTGGELRNYQIFQINGISLGGSDSVLTHFNQPSVILSLSKDQFGRSFKRNRIWGRFISYQSKEISLVRIRGCRDVETVEPPAIAVANESHFDKTSTIFKNAVSRVGELGTDALGEAK